MRLSQKVTAVALGLVMASSLAAVAVQTTGILTRADNTYVMKCYARADIDNTTKYFRYNSQKLEPLDENDDKANAIYTFTFTSTNTAYIKNGSTNIGWSSGTNLNNNEYLWTIENGNIYNANKDRLLLYRGDTYKVVRPYSIQNIEGEGYSQIYFYTQGEYNNGNGRCGWNEFQQNCLQNLIHTGQDTTPPEIIDDTPTPIVEGTTITITPNDSGWTSTAGEQTGTVSGITLYCSNGVTGTTQAEGSTMRVYKDATFTISASFNLKSIELTCTANGTTKYGPGCFGSGAPSGYSYENKVGTWVGESNSITFTASSAQVRITQIVIIY